MASLNLSTCIGGWGSAVSSQQGLGRSRVCQHVGIFWARETCLVVTIIVHLYEPKCINWGEASFYIFGGDRGGAMSLRLAELAAAVNFRDGRFG